MPKFYLFLGFYYYEFLTLKIKVFLNSFIKKLPINIFLFFLSFVSEANSQQFDIMCIFNVAGYSLANFDEKSDGFSDKNKEHINSYHSK